MVPRISLAIFDYNLKLSEVFVEIKKRYCRIDQETIDSKSLLC